MGEAERQAQHQRVEQVVASGSVEHDLRQALEVSSPNNFVHVAVLT